MKLWEDDTPGLQIYQRCWFNRFQELTLQNKTWDIQVFFKFGLTGSLGCGKMHSNGATRTTPTKMPWAYFFLKLPCKSSPCPSLSFRFLDFRMFFLSQSLAISSLQTALFFSGQHSWFMVQELIEGLLCEAMVYVIQGEIIGYPYLGSFFCFSPTTPQIRGFLYW